MLGVYAFLRKYLLLTLDTINLCLSRAFLMVSLKKQNKGGLLGIGFSKEYSPI